MSQVFLDSNVVFVFACRRSKQSQQGRGHAELNVHSQMILLKGITQIKPSMLGFES
jgi:hypothetical protein